MKNNTKYLTSTLFFVCMLATSFSNAQHRLSFDTLPNGLTPGTNISIPLRTYDFIGILGLQGSINWDTTILKFNGITYATNNNIKLDSSDFNISTNYLTFFWYDAALNPESVPDSTILFSLNFTLLKLGYDSSSVFISNTPTPVQIVDSASIMPVTLKTFSGNWNDGIVNLKWETANEVNSSYFEVQRSGDGMNFLSIYSVKAVNNNGAVYSYADKNIGSSNLFYRLKMVDKGSTYTFSKVISIDVNGHKYLSIYPNPVKNLLTLHLENDRVENATVQILDISGKMVKQQFIQLNAGANIIPIDVAALPKGSYLMIIKGNNQQQQLFIKN